jgi:hypothetical protein
MAPQLYFYNAGYAIPPVIVTDDRICKTERVSKVKLDVTTWSTDVHVFIYVIRSIQASLCPSHYRHCRTISHVVHTSELP